VGKERTIFVCQKCGSQAPRWLGRCPDCGEWGSLVEERIAQAVLSPVGPGSMGGKAAQPLSIAEIETTGEDRMKTQMNEFDRVLGGGFVPGSIVLVGGDPGIGKSTLILQSLDRMAGAGFPILYVTGEESLRQVKMRAERLGAGSSGLHLLAETCLERIIEAGEKMNPRVMAVDSIQTVFSESLTSAPGSLSQVREVAGRLMYFSKASGITTLIVGHVTKEGAIAGPKALEHIVDAVLYFEGDRGHAYRILRSVKNRFGSVSEIGVFEMREDGLQEIVNPSELFLSERPKESSGSVVVSSVEGSRPLLVELQALVCPTSFGLPRRTSIGVDYNRVSLLVAVLEKKVGLHLSDKDIFVNVAGGISIDEPAVDLGVISAVASSSMDKPIDPHTIIIGEVGLGGEVRAVRFAETRAKEGARLGFTRCLIPEGNKKKMKPMEGMEITGVATIAGALDLIF